MVCNWRRQMAPDDQHRDCFPQLLVISMIRLTIATSGLSERKIRGYGRSKDCNHNREGLIERKSIIKNQSAWTSKEQSTDLNTDIMST